jgi:glycosyltransferase involved in cell wall biosynthesis
MMNTCAVVTTLDEADSIGWLVVSLRDQGLAVCVVDDASDDDTVYLARHAGAHVIAHMLRRGIGPSLVEGWRWALGQGATAVVQLDAGRSHYPQAATWLLGRLGDADVLVGSRFCDGASYRGSMARQMLSKAAALACNVRYFHAITGVSDWTSGYRVFSAGALRKLARLEYTATMHGWQIEVLQAALWLRLRVVEAPITYVGGRSSFSRRVAKEAFGVWNSQRFALRS